MSYRIKLEPKGGPVDETQLLSGMERFFILLQEHRRAVLLGSALSLVAVAAVLAVVWYDQRQAEQALELHHRAMTLYVDRPSGQAAKADENLKQAIVLFHQVVEQYPRTPTAQMSL